MNILYAKTILYAYAHLLEIASQIDDLVLKKALSSMSNIAPAYKQYQEVEQLTYEKDVVFVIKKVCDKVLNKFTEEEMKYFHYKYFKDKPKSFYEGFDTTSRTYFRKQVSLVKKFSERLEKSGIDDKFFIKKCLEVDFFKQLLRRTEEYEKILRKNKPKHVCEGLN